MLRPLGANVVVKADAVEEKTKSGIFIPDTASKEKPMQKYEGEELLILAERDILAVVEPDTKKKK